MTRTMQALFLAVLAAVAACDPEGAPTEGEGEGGSGVPCDDAHHCSILDDEPTCDPGFVFESLSETDNFNCVDTGWIIEDSTDPIDDARELQFIKDANDTYEDFLGQTVQPRVSTLCKTGEQTLMVFQTGALETDSQDRVVVTLRFDEAEAFDAPAVESNGVVFFPTADANGYSQRLFNSSRLVVRFPPLDGFLVRALEWMT